MFTLMGIEFKKFIRNKKFLVGLAFLIAIFILMFFLIVCVRPKRVGVKNTIDKMQKYVNELEEKGNQEKDKGAVAVSSAYDKLLKEGKEFLEVEKMKADPNIPWRKKVERDIKSSQDNLKRNSELHPDAEHSELSNIRLKKYYLDHNIPYDYDDKITAFNNFPDTIRIIATFGLFIIVGVMASNVVSGENKPATIKLLLTKPIKRWKVILSKFIVAVVTVNLIILLLEFIYFILVGLIFGFGDASLPVLTDVKYRVVEAAYIAQEGGAVVPYAGSGVLISTGSLIVKMLILQVLGVTSTIAFCFLMAVVIKNPNNSMILSLILIAFTHAIFNIKVNDYSMQRLKPATVLDRFLAVLFPIYHNSIDVVSGRINRVLAVDFITFKFSVILLLVWIGVCYGITHVVFVKKDVLA